MRKMLTFASCFAAIGALSLSGTTSNGLYAQQGSSQERSNQQPSSGDSEQNDAQEDQSTSDQQARQQFNRDQQSSQQSRQRDPELRLQYDDEDNRLSIDVDEEIQFQDSDGQESWTRGGQLDLRYDRERNALRGSAQGAVRLDQVGSDLAQWWQSWWEEERQQRRAGRESSERGAATFLGQHDENDDGYLSRRELPQHLEDEFARIDRNDDRYISRTEIRQYGDQIYREQQQRMAQQNQRNQQQTWSEWWNSWWSEQNTQGDAEQAFAQGSSEFLRRHDRNDDGQLVRSELPSRMYDEFEYLDRNEDSVVTRREIQWHAQESMDALVGYRQEEDSRDQVRQQSRDQQSRGQRSRGASQGQRQSRAANRRATADEMVLAWVIDFSAGERDRQELQRAYDYLWQLDQNGDGELSERELRQQLQQVVQRWSNSRFSKFDQNDDQRLNPQEARNTVFGNQFDRFDRNGDDQVSLSEVRSTLLERSGSQNVSTGRNRNSRQ